MSIAAGRLRHRVRIESLEPQRDSHGAIIRDPVTGETEMVWSEVATVWAAIEPISAREFAASGALQSQVTTRIVMRFRDDVTAAMRVVHAPAGRVVRVYNIQGVLADLDSGQEYMTLPCREGTNDG